MQIYANPAGLERAEAEARKLGALIACKEFDWCTYRPDVVQTAETLTTGQWVERFKAEYMRTHSLKETTWHFHWWCVYKRLPLDEPLKESTLLSVVHKTEKETRNRKQTCEKLQKLANFAGMAVDLNRYSGSYSSSKVQPRDLPTDEVISEWQGKVPNLGWRWVYGMLATYGLRPHEAFFCKFLDDSLDRVIQVTEGKTKGRKVYPLYPEWVENWELWKVNRPDITGKTYKEYGNRTTRQFQRYKIPFPAYDLRHAYAIRASIVFNFPVPIAAAFMGHSPTVHWNRYNRWISEKQHADVFQSRIQDKDRPIAP
ncbi:hypothetical protein ACQ4N7_23255 [Nodosilinea sp. AN01ver1]|uniref:hypothetical protein n=1 Tax=Nodosilinea sp. AN01ver1 TaxID=3423362 RepID=UPI003D31FE7F